MSDSSYANEDMQDYDENIAWDEVGVPPGEGKYNFTIDKAEYKPTQAKKHMIKLQFKIEAAVDADNERFIGRTVFGNFVFTQGAAFTVKAFCKNLDIPLPETVNKAFLEDWLAEHLLTGLTFGATIKHRKFNDQLQADLGQSFEPAFDISGSSVDTSGQGTVADTSGQDPMESEEPEMTDATEEEQTTEVEPEPTPTRTIRQAAPNGKAVNGHTNGSSGTKPATKAVKPASKDKPQARK